MYFSWLETIHLKIQRMQPLPIMSEVHWLETSRFRQSYLSSANDSWKEVKNPRHALIALCFKEISPTKSELISVPKQPGTCPSSVQHLGPLKCNVDRREDGFEKRATRKRMFYLSTCWTTSFLFFKILDIGRTQKFPCPKYLAAWQTALTSCSVGIWSILPERCLFCFVEEQLMVSSMPKFRPLLQCMDVVRPVRAVCNQEASHFLHEQTHERQFMSSLLHACQASKVFAMKLVTLILLGAVL